MALTSASPASRTSPHAPWPSIALGVGLFLVFVGERILGVGRPGQIASVLGVLAVAAAVGAQGLRLRAARGFADRKAPETTLLWLFGLAALALLLYFIGSDLTFHLTGKTLTQRAPRLAAVTETLWPALLVTALIPIVFIEVTLASMRRAPVVDGNRVRAAQMSGLSIGLALVFCFSFGYVTSERDLKADLSYFRVAKAGDSTLKIVKALDKPVTVSLFFPPANEVGEEVESYFADLSKQSKLLSVTLYDAALSPAKAKELSVSANGTIVVARDKNRQQIALPLQLERARTGLRTLDQDVHKRLLGVTRPPRIAYFTQGHEERTFSAVGETDRRGTVSALKQLLEDQGYDTREMGLAQGLANELPTDAGLVLIIGPRKPFLAEEAAALQRFVEKKGRVLIALDPEAGLDFKDVVGPLGLAFRPTVLANDRAYWRRSYQPSDRENIATGSYSSHASVTSLSKLGLRAPVVLLGAGSLDRDDKSTRGIVSVNFTVHADGSTWDDKNHNYELDAANGEARKAYELAAAVTVRNASALGVEDEGRAVVFADSDALTDAVLQNVGNAYLVLDAINWLSGEEAIAGTVNNEEDVPLTHTRKQDVAWFYGTVMLAPALVFAAGLLVTGRRRAGRRAAAAARRTSRDGGQSASDVPSASASNDEVSR